MSAKTRFFLIAAISAGALAVGSYLLRTPGTMTAAATTQERQPGATAPAGGAARVSARVMALGRIEPVSELVRVGAPAAQDSGRLADILIKEGDWVERGDVIAVLDTSPRLTAAFRQAEATLAVRRAALAKLSADLDNQEKTLTAALEQQEAQRDRAKWEFERLQQLQKSGIYRDTALIDKRLAVESANFVLESARFTLQRNQKREANGMRIDETGSQAEIDQAEASVAKARADLEFSIIRAPITGRIVRRMGRPGEQISSEGLAEIADTRVMYVRAEVFESDLRHVTVGATVTVTSRAIDGTLTGQVERLGFKVNRQSIIGEDPAAALDARVVDVLVRLDEASSKTASRLTGLQVRASFAVPASS
jgi:HlyD family secretion protein